MRHICRMESSGDKKSETELSVGLVSPWLVDGGLLCGSHMVIPLCTYPTLGPHLSFLQEH